MGFRAFHLVLLMLASYYVISSDAIPMSRITNLAHGKGQIVVSETMFQDNIKGDSIKGRMDIEMTNDYGPTGSNPVHTPQATAYLNP